MQARRWLTHTAPAALLLMAIASCQGPLLIISPTVLPNVIVGNTYQRTLGADSENPLLWRISAGALPPGLSLNEETGVIMGTFTQAGTFTFTIAVEEPGLFFRVGEQAYTLTVIPKLTLDATLENARQDVAYSDNFEVAGGVVPYTFEVVGLPGGVTYDESSGVVSGTPVAAVAGQTVQVTVNDSGDPQQTITKQITFVIKPPPVNITTTGLADGEVGVAYSQELSAEDGFPPYTWSVEEGVLPETSEIPAQAQVRLNQSTGQITGTPTEAGSWTFTITVSDADSPETTDSEEFTIVIAP